MAHGGCAVRGGGIGGEGTWVPYGDRGIVCGDSQSYPLGEADRGPVSQEAGLSAWVSWMGWWRLWSGTWYVWLLYSLFQGLLPICPGTRRLWRVWADRDWSCWTCCPLASTLGDFVRLAFVWGSELSTLGCIGLFLLSVGIERATGSGDNALASLSTPLHPHPVPCSHEACQDWP